MPAEQPVNATRSARGRLIAFYLPQFHPIPENDSWWGPGFTEWTNVAASRPLFPGHQQPNLPGELGFYDLRLPETRWAQAELALAHGIEGFCYWHYWFEGRQILDRPFREVLTTGEPSIAFCLGWANQSWTGVWHGAPSRTLIAQTYGGSADIDRHFYAVLPALTDPRAITVNGKPLFYIYRPAELPDPRLFTDRWRELASREGLPGLYLLGERVGPWTPSTAGLDGEVAAPLAALAMTSLHRRAARRLLTMAATLGVRTYPFDRVALVPQQVLEVSHPTYPCVLTGWDNTPRSGRRGFVLTRRSSESLATSTRAALEAVQGRVPQERLVFIKSWNEWAEGNYLEPDRRSGRKYLAAVAEEAFLDESIEATAAKNSSA